MAIQTAQWAASRIHQPERVPADDGTPGTYHIWTIGCQMNKADSDRLGDALEQLGLTPAPTAQHADVVVFNSCVVRQSAEDKVVGALGMAKALKKRRPERIVALMGCMVGPKKDALESRFGHVDVFMQPQQYAPLLELVGERLGVDYEGCIGPLTDAHADVTSYIPIIQGCDLFCSFCIIPYRRGRQVSRTAARRGARGGAAGGARRPRGHAARADRRRLRPRFTGRRGPGRLALRAERRVRAGAHPLPDLASNVHERPHHRGRRRSAQGMRAHQPPRAGGRRRGALGHAADVLGGRVPLDHRAHPFETVPGVALSTDLIVGFCGETKEAFEASYRLLEQVRFDKVHVAQYSTREGTIAHRTLTDDVPKEEKRRRMKAVDALQERVATEINARLLGETLEVLVEGRDKGKWRGRTRTDKLVFFEDAGDFHGKLARVRVTKTSPWSLQGEPAEV